MVSPWCRGPVNRPDRSHSDHIRLLFVHEPERLREGVERLAQAWRAYTPGPGRAREAVGVIV